MGWEGRGKGCFSPMQMRSVFGNVKRKQKNKILPLLQQQLEVCFVVKWTGLAIRRTSISVQTDLNAMLIEQQIT